MSRLALRVLGGSAHLGPLGFRLCLTKGLRTVSPQVFGDQMSKNDKRWAQLLEKVEIVEAPWTRGHVYLSCMKCISRQFEQARVAKGVRK